MVIPIKDSVVEVNKVGELVTQALDPDAQVIWGARIDPNFQGKARIITIITGVKSPYILGPVEEHREARTLNQELGIKGLA